MKQGKTGRLIVAALVAFSLGIASFVPAQAWAAPTQKTKKWQKAKPQTIPDSPAIPSDGPSHTVVAGDTVFKISKRYQVDAAELCRLNQIKNNRIRLGQVLILPGTAERAGEAAEEEPAVEKLPLAAPGTALPDNLFVALCRALNAIAVKQALKEGANPNARDGAGTSALMAAVQVGHGGEQARLARMEMVGALLDAGADVNARDHRGQTALMRADSQPIVRLLLGTAELDLRDQDGKTALTWMAEQGNAALVGLLLDAGANAAIRDKDGKTALDHALARGHAEIARELRSAGR